jgi:hypothetical protein
MVFYLADLILGVDGGFLRYGRRGMSMGRWRMFECGWVSGVGIV